MRFIEKIEDLEEGNIYQFQSTEGEWFDVKIEFDFKSNPLHNGKDYYQPFTLEKISLYEYVQHKINNKQIIYK